MRESMDITETNGVIKTRKRKARKSVDPGDDKQAEVDPIIAQEKLLAYGEQFMRMFDDYDSDREAKNAKVAVDRNGDSESDSGGSPSEHGSFSRDVFPSAIVKETPKKQRKVPEIFSPVEFANPSTPEDRGGIMSRRKDWKMFMSPKASEVHRSQVLSPTVKAENESVSQAKLFSAMAKEVENLGAAQLDKRNHKKWEMKKLADLGAKLSKSPKCSPGIGLGIKRKAEKREMLQREEDIAAGMIRIKGSGIAKQKQKSLQKRRSVDDRGIQASDGKFRNGILYVEPDKIAKSHGSGRSSTKKGDGVKLGFADNRGKRGHPKAQRKSKAKQKSGKGKRRK